ncbi:MAG TPA: hypothetical protein VGZ23_18355, partial [bacterium]|nr:hypothetical protein [bacterium]
MRQALATWAPSNGEALTTVTPLPVPSANGNGHSNGNGHRAPEATRAGKSTQSRIDPIGKVLLAREAVTQDQLTQALGIQRESRGPLGRILVEMGVVSERELARAVAQQWGLPFAELSDDSVNSEAARLIPPALAQRHGVIAVGRTADRVVVAMPDPSNIVAIDDIRLLTGLDVEIIIASADDIARAHSQFLGIGADMEALLRTAPVLESEVVEEPAGSEEIAVERLRTMVEEAPIVRVVNQVIHQAIRAGASDIHLEPHRREVKVRFRIDGLLQ